MPVIDGLLYAKQESTAGTYLQPVAADVLEPERGDAVFTLAGQTAPIERTVLRHHMEPELPAAAGGYWWDLSFSHEVKCSGGATSAPELGPMLEACGFDEDVNAANVEYFIPNDYNGAPQPVSLNFEEHTNGTEYQAAGCTFNLELSHSSDQRLMANFSGNGAYSAAPTDVSAIASPSFHTEAAIVSLGNSNPFSYFGNTGLCLRSWGVNLNATPNMRPNLAAGSGSRYNKFPSFWTTTGITFTAEVEAEDVSFYDHWGATAAATLGDISVTMVAGSRTFEVLLYDCTAAAPVRVPGAPNTYQLTANAHRHTAGDGGSGSDKSSSLILRFS